MKGKIVSASISKWYYPQIGEIVEIVEHSQMKDNSNVRPYYYYVDGDLDKPIFRIDIEILKETTDNKSNLSPFHERLINEQLSLIENIVKLESFIKGNLFNMKDGIDPIQKSLLLIQLQAMKTYNQCLLQRIDWLTKEKK